MFLKGGVVYQDIQLPELPGGILHSTAAKLGIGHIAREQDSPAAFSFHGAPNSSASSSSTQVDDGNIGSFASIQDGHCPADPESPPVIRATMPASFSEPRYSGAWY